MYIIINSLIPPPSSVCIQRPELVHVRASLVSPFTVKLDIAAVVSVSQVFIHRWSHSINVYRQTVTIGSQLVSSIPFKYKVHIILPCISTLS